MPCGWVNPTPRVFNGDSRVDSLWRLGGAPVTFLFCKPHPHPSFAYGAERSAPPFIVQTFFHWRLASYVTEDLIALVQNTPYSPPLSVLPFVGYQTSTQAALRITTATSGDLCSSLTSVFAHTTPSHTFRKTVYISRKPLSCVLYFSLL